MTDLWVSSVPEAIDALVATLKAFPGLADVEVDDGPAVTSSGRMEAIVVGFEDEAGEIPAVESQTDLAGPVMNPAKETFTLGVLIEVVNNQLPRARTRVYQLLANVISALAADKTLGGAVMSARVSSHVLRQQAGKGGKRARLAVTVDCDGWTRRSA